MISILGYFILGVCFYVIGIPVIEGLGNLLAQLLEVWKGYLLVALAKTQVTIRDIKKEKKDEEINTSHAIGFSLPSIEEEEEEDEDDE